MAAIREYIKTSDLDPAKFACSATGIQPLDVRVIQNAGAPGVSTPNAIDPTATDTSPVVLIDTTNNEIWNWDPVGATWFQEPHPDEVIEAAGPLVGAAPAGAQWGVDTTSGTAYYVSGGNWAPIPIVTVDLNTTVSDQTGGNYGGGAPAAAPAGQDDGDLHVEIYDDVVAYFTASGGSWPASAQVTATRFTDTDLGYTASPTNGTVTNTEGTDAVIPLADGTNAGLVIPGPIANAGDILVVAPGGGYQLVDQNTVAVADTSCIDLTANTVGTVTTISADPILDPNVDNILSCGPAGLLVDWCDVVDNLDALPLTCTGLTSI